MEHKNSNGLPDIRPRPSKLTSINVANVYLAAFIPNEKSNCAYIITASKFSIEIWKKRINDEYYKHATIKQIHSKCTCITYNLHEKTLFLGLADGWVYWYDFLVKHPEKVAIKGDCKLYKKKVLRIILLGKHLNNIISCNSSINVSFHQFEATGRWWIKNSGYELDSNCTVLEYDYKSEYAFVGQKSGQITILNCQDGYLLLESLCWSKKMLRDQKNSVSCLKWVENHQWLISGFSDGSITVFTVTDGKVENYFQLYGHTSKISSFFYIETPRMLISSSLDWTMLKWDMSPEIQRTNPPELDTKHQCQICSRPGKWNILKRAIEKRKAFELSHCLHCGKTICEKCSRDEINNPAMGFELAVHTCRLCAVKFAERAPTTAMNYIPGKIRYMDAIECPYWVVTVTNISVDVYEYGRHLKLVDI